MRVARGVRERLRASVTRILSESTTASETLRQLLETLGRGGRCDFGCYWRIDYNDLTLRCGPTWAARPGAYPRFELITRARVMGAGVGLPGRILYTKMPLWLADVTVDENYPRAWIAQEEGLHTAVGLPVVADRQIVGVFEFNSAPVLPPDEALLPTLAAIGADVGQFFGRVRLEEAITGSLESFEEATAGAVDAILTINEESIILFANQGAAHLFGYSVEEMRGQNLRMVIPPELQQRHEAGMARYLKSGIRGITWDGVELPAITKAGERLQVIIAFGEYLRAGKRIFSGYVRRRGEKSGGAGSHAAVPPQD